MSVLLMVSQVFSLPRVDATTAASTGPWTFHGTVGTSPVTDDQGTVWHPLATVGGRMVTGRPVNDGGADGLFDLGPASASLYRQARIGVRSATIAVPQAGTYALDLLMAESAGTAAGQREFTVLANNVVVLRHVDIAHAVGDSVPYHQFFTVATRSKEIVLRFVAQRGQPEISAIAGAQLSTGDGLRKTWSADFGGKAGSRPNGWTYTTGQTGFGNNEAERYTRSTVNSHLDGHGALVIAMKKAHNTFTSARLNSRHGFEYGVLQASIDLPAGQALWPAFWMLADDIGKVGWPASGEVDVLEGIGQHPKEVHAGVIGPPPNGQSVNWDLAAFYHSSTPLAGGFHTYAILWTPVGIAFSVDGQQFFSATPEDLPAGGHWVQDRPYHVILNVAVGGTFGGAVTASTPHSATMTVKDLQIWQ